MATPVILDCDPGHDDAMAILLAAADPAVDLLAITTVAGAQTLDKVSTNARLVCTVAGLRDVPVAVGAARPLVRPLLVAESLHGGSGLDGLAVRRLPEVPVAGEAAVPLMRRLLVASDRPVSIIATGPLTNVAQLLWEHPEVVPQIEQVVWTGGTTTRGNITPYTEFNATVDPEAVDAVLRGDVPLHHVRAQRDAPGPGDGRRPATAAADA